MRYWPIIYVRGYAMTQSEIDDTTADPFCGFNLGSTVYRATSDPGKPKKFVFESPVIRLGTDFGYCDVYKDGMDIVDPDWNDQIFLRSIVIYHYYDPASTLLGEGKTPPIESFARGLSTLINCIREKVCANASLKDDNCNPITLSRDDFRCYLVAHSMGGLVCRAFLQNPALDVMNVKECVAKVFTFATPHNGIDMGGVNVPSWLSQMDLDNFNRKRMADYLGPLESFHFGKSGRVDVVPDPDKYFCMIGTNRSDYEVAMGLSRTFVGHGSDGLVRIENASVGGFAPDGLYTPAATAYTYRSHSGFFGIVNSEEGYQNLTRFLFGDVRVDIWVDVDAVTLPVDLQSTDPAKVEALYQFEVLVSPRGKRWTLSRRISEEDSVACRTHSELTGDPERKRIYLSSAFLAISARVNPDDPTLSYSLMLGVKVPDYEVDRKLWFDKHYEGSDLFRDTVIVKLIPPANPGEGWQVWHGWQSASSLEANAPLTPQPLPAGDKAEVVIPFDGNKTPGIAGKIRFVVSPWNR